MSPEPALAVRADDCLAELASLLATGLLRWHEQRRLLEIRAYPDYSRKECHQWRPRAQAILRGGTCGRMLLTYWTLVRVVPKN